MYNRIILITAALFAAVSAHARHVAADTLDVATVTAEKGVLVSRADTITLSNSTEAGQALMSIPSLSVTDMGGYSGLKTVSLRGLGTSHTSIYVDGIRVGNLQSGQSDLGMLGMENFRTAVIDYAQNSINFITLRPTFGSNDKGKAGRFSTSASLKAGSFHTYIPSLKIGMKLNDRTSMSISAAGTLSKGDFPYLSTDQNGNTSLSRRAGNDIRQIRTGIDVFGAMRDGDWHVKAYFNDSDRGTPGSLSWPSEDRQRDRNIFIQGGIDNRFNDIYTLKISSKGSYDDMSYLSSWGDSRYQQMEFQLNTSHIFSIKEWWQASVAVGGQWDNLISGNYGSADGVSSAEGINRLDFGTALASRIDLDRFKADLALEYEGIMDSDKDSKLLSLNSFSPSASIRYAIYDDLSIVAFGRRAFRAPMFNELYYIGFDNKDLKPEDVWLTDIGIEWKVQTGSYSYISAKADGFFNWLDNKITSAPTEDNPDIWLPYNIGKVFSAGTDISAAYRYDDRQWKAGISVRYTFQDARDKTPGSYSYDTQIPYISKHSGVISGDASWKSWTAAARWNLRSGRVDSSGDLPDWNTLDICISRSFSLSKYDKKRSIVLSITASNLTDTRYELSRGYPMPGRSILGGISIRL